MCYLVIRIYTNNQGAGLRDNLRGNLRGLGGYLGLVRWVPGSGEATMKQKGSVRDQVRDKVRDQVRDRFVYNRKRQKNKIKIRPGGKGEGIR